MTWILFKCAVGMVLLVFSLYYLWEEHNYRLFKRAVKKLAEEDKLKAEDVEDL